MLNEGETGWDGIELSGVCGGWLWAGARRRAWVRTQSIKASITQARLQGVKDCGVGGYACFLIFLGGGSVVVCPRTHVLWRERRGRRGFWEISFIPVKTHKHDTNGAHHRCTRTRHAQLTRVSSLHIRFLVSLHLLPPSRNSCSQGPSPTTFYIFSRDMRGAEGRGCVVVDSLWNGGVNECYKNQSYSS